MHGTSLSKSTLLNRLPLSYQYAIQTNVLLFGGIIFLSTDIAFTGTIDLTKFSRYAEQSSTANVYSADKAVDGNYIGTDTPTNDKGLAYCTHTLLDETPWWTIKLDQPYFVQIVKIYNRKMDYTRLQRLTVRVGMDHTISNQSVCAFFNETVPQGSYSTIRCSCPLRGLYISVQKMDRGYLTLCEVEAEGFAESNVVCDDPGTPDGAYKYGTPYRLNDVVRYSCHSGWTSTGGDGVRTCQPDKAWSGLPIICEKNNTEKACCRDPKQPIIKSADPNYDENGKTTNISFTWQVLSSTGHGCNTYTKLQVAYTNELGRKETKQLPSFMKSNSYNIRISFPMKSEYLLVLHVFNDEELSSSSDVYRVPKMVIDDEAREERQREDRNTNFGLPIGCFIAGAAFVLLILGILILVRRWREKVNKEVCRTSLPLDIKNTRNLEQELSQNTEVQPYEEVQRPTNGYEEAVGHQQLNVDENTYQELSLEAVSSSPTQCATTPSSSASVYDTVSE